MKVQLLVDNPNSWIIPYAKDLKGRLYDRSIQTCLIHNHEEVTEGDILCLLSCEKIFRKLHLNNFNLVVHESALPAGKGWSPLTWQILEGKNEIPITLFEAAENVDAGEIYLEDTMYFEGHELVDELRKVQGSKTIELILRFIDALPNIRGKKQVGKSSYYKRRSAKDSLVDINDSLESQFNLLRVCDNHKYPAYFIRDGIKYVLKIEKEAT